MGSADGLFTAVRRRLVAQPAQDCDGDRVVIFVKHPFNDEVIKAVAVQIGNRQHIEIIGCLRAQLLLAQMERHKPSIDAPE
jgi:hypothetical protein